MTFTLTCCDGCSDVSRITIFCSVPPPFSLLWDSPPHLLPLHRPIPRLRPHRHVAHIAHLSGGKTRLFIPPSTPSLLDKDNGVLMTGMTMRVMTMTTELIIHGRNQGRRVADLQAVLHAPSFCLHNPPCSFPCPIYMRPRSKVVSPPIYMRQT